ncbi:MAG: TonB-dependent receptor, partial [Bacteroidota bacterium]|nr:TonB-dependent receptor [Bacteroidota bacterium]
MKRILLSALIFFSALFLNAQNVTISGYIEDVGSGERLIGANIFDASDKKYGTATNSYGFFSLSLPKGKHLITVSYIGYGFWQTEMDLTKDTSITIQISTDIKLKQVVIIAKHNQVESSQMGRVDVPVSMIKSLPAMFGEVDVLKTIQLLPGVQSGTEGSSGVYVRGGGPDQNLILLDGVPVYNANHLFGFFSVFNADAISNVALYKGGFPARYGGRLSSVIDINLKEGNMKKFTGNVSIGLISSKFTIEGPIVKDKTSFIISARRTYIDIIAAPFIALGQKINDPDGKIKFSAGYYFYDFNAKINHKISNKDRVFF